MTSKYDEAVFEFITKEENFSAACEISDNFQKIKDRLIEEFWKEVKELLEEKNKQENKKWCIGIEKPDINEDRSNLGFWFAGGDIRVMFYGLSGKSYNLWYGLWINKENEKLKEKIELYDSEIQRLKDNKGMCNFRWFLASEDTGYNFQTKETLERILPHNRSELSKDLADLLFEFTDEMYDPIILGFEKNNS